MNRLFLALTILLITSCALTSPAPEISLVDVAFDEISLFETNLKAKVRYENELDTDLQIRGSVHRLSLNGIDVGKGISDEAITIPRLGTKTQLVTFRISNLGLLTKVQRLIDSQGYNYEIRSKVYAGKGFNSKTFHIVNDGELGPEDVEIENDTP